jgi:hypothetical protein
MTIWLLALVLFGCLAAIGYQQGAIRVAISFLGILVAALTAGLTGKLVKPAVVAVGVANPIIQWVLPPFLGFVIVLAIFKVAATFVHRKVDVYYKYRAGDLRLALWERLNARLGLCLGFLNATVYLVLIAMVFFPLTYWTVQLTSPNEDSRMLRLANRFGRDLQQTGMARVARAIDPMPEIFYKAADLAGLLYQNPLLEARLSRYPPFLALAEKPEFQAIGQDKSLTEARLRGAPLREILGNPGIAAIVKSPDQLRYLWGMIEPDLDDLVKFLHEGKSDKYTDPILGRWQFDVNAAIAAYRIAKTNVSSSEMRAVKMAYTMGFSKLALVCFPDRQLVLKHFPDVKLPQPGQLPTIETRNVQGKWKRTGEEYELSLTGLGTRKARLESGRLVFLGEVMPMVFSPED